MRCWWLWWPFWFSHLLVPLLHHQDQQNSTTVWSNSGGICLLMALVELLQWGKCVICVQYHYVSSLCENECFFFVNLCWVSQFHCLSLTTRSTELSVYVVNSASKNLRKTLLFFFINTLIISSYNLQLNMAHSCLVPNSYIKRFNDTEMLNISFWCRWNSWNHFSCQINEKMIRETGIWSYVCIMWILYLSIIIN